MTRGERVNSPKEKKQVPGWSIEEMKEKPIIAVEEDTEEMRKWRGLSQSEMDLCWKKLAEKMEAREVPLRAEVTPWNGRECAKTRDTK